jgi:hypothetical protein
VRWRLHGRKEQLDDGRDRRILDVLEKVGVLRRVRDVPLSFVGQTDEQLVDERIAESVGLSAKIVLLDLDAMRRDVALALVMIVIIIVVVTGLVVADFAHRRPQAENAVLRLVRCQAILVNVQLFPVNTKV